MSVTLAQLRAFVSVAQHNGFTAASRALGVSQSTISSQIQQLEQEYGVELFRRRGKRVDLSSIGMELLPLARQMAALESDTHTLLCDSGALRRGVLKIGAVGQYHITDMIEAYYAVHPLIRLNVTLGNSEVVLNDLDDYTCDVGIVASRHPDERYYMQSYASYPVIVFVNASHRFATRSSVALSELAGERLLMREPGSTTRRALEDALLEHNVIVQVAMEIGSREALREAVARGLGVGTVSQSEYVPDPRLRPVRIEGNVVWTHIQVCCLRERRDSMLIASFFDAVERCRVRSQ
ncbi:LysR substrate-binding domain-containing protein [Paraburkholderia ferrariae]|jgi:aminoethylphosphonate catabolism LysR family transcriptional regulator|uniref:LysR substrate-binding domain-containing protein n=1 Tax=Paraburkholderia ferrariae TaxID=386056 RepID=UPI0005A8E0F0|nr:LysR substrate-binding domain-containing protein [Paraburkholderia ferrariae]